MQNLIQYNDDFLVKLYLREKSKPALEVLFYRHKDSLLQAILYWGIPRDQAEDLVQDTFYKVIDSLNKHNYQCENKFFGWMLRIAKNLMIDQKRREKRGKELINESFEPSFFGYDTQEDSLDFVEQEHLIHQVEKVMSHLEQLSYEQKEIITLRIFHELSFKEISQKLDISINTALGRMRYALINLRKKWEAGEVASTRGDL